jgi:hypothetical protein
MFVKVSSSSPAYLPPPPLLSSFSLFFGYHFQMILSMSKCIRDAAIACFVQRESPHIFKAEEVLGVQGAMSTLLAFLLDVPDIGNPLDVAVDAAPDM